MLQAGKLNRRVLIRRWQDQPDTGFAIEQEFGPGIPAWASIVPVGAAIFYGAKQTGEGVTHRVTIRRRPGLTETEITGEHVVDAEGLRYRVRRASAWQGEREAVLLDVELLAKIA
ncbi:head-tail adaptor protein [Cupriavidus respiraculi]|uniref:head-tail adaptor protein n=1 Tax=Cupriavidus respiraculi TaxID=195930 RepID=UPI001CC42DEB|nr:head-tail adaptor protein [Cupriavidus respiraculi]